MINSNPRDKKSSSDAVFAVDLGGTHLRAALVDENGKIRFRFKQNTPRTENPDDIVQAIVAAVRSCELDGPASAVSVVVPGTVNVEKGAVVRAPNLPSLNRFCLSAALERELKLLAFIENDANAAAVGELWQGAGRGRHSVICLTLGTGVGGGIILADKLWRGADGSAAEIGHMAVDPFLGVACPCGSRGCLEVYASATAIVRMAREERSHYPNSIVRQDDDLTAREVYAAGIEGDELAQEVFRRMGVYLGVGLANLINLLNPEIIILGGGVVDGWVLFEKHMRQEVAQRAFPLPAARVQIARAECGDDAGLLGAARLAFASRLDKLNSA
jgi:glucokinase